MGKILKACLAILTFSILLSTFTALSSCGGGNAPRGIAPPPPPPPPPPAGEVTGRVTDSYGNPLANAGVLIDGEEFGIVTDSDGNFTIPASVIGTRDRSRLRIGVRHLNQVLGVQEVDASSGEVNLRFGDPDENGGTVNGVTYDSATGEAVANALVVLFRVPGFNVGETQGASESAPPWVSFVETDANGNFEFTEVPEGTFNVFVFHSNYKMKLITAEVSSGMTTQLMIELESKFVQEPADRYYVSGYVRNSETGEPVAGAFVQGNSDSGWFYIMGAEGSGVAPPAEWESTDEDNSVDSGAPVRPDIYPPPPMPPWEPPVYQDTTTDENGYFEFEAPFNGAGVYISVSHETYMPFSQYYTREADDTLDLEIQMTPIVPVHVSGRVTDPDGNGIASAYVEFIYIYYGYGDGIALPAGGDLKRMDPTGLALAGAELQSDAPAPPNYSGGSGEPYDNYAMQRFRHEQRNRQERGASQVEIMPFGYYSAVTDENGNFDLGEIPSGFYSTFAQAYGYLGYWNELEITEDTSDYQIVLEPVPVGEIEGRVVDEDGVPVPDALVNATQPNVDPFTFTDENGEFLLTNVPAGIWRVGAYKEGYYAGVLDMVEVKENDTVTVQLELTKIENPEPPETLTFSGKMIDGTTGEPLAGVEMVAVKTDDSHHFYTVSGTDGYFEMDLVPGDYTLNARKEGYVDLFTWFWVDPEFTSTDFYLWPIGYNGGWGGGPVPMRGGWVEDGTDVPPPSAPGMPPPMM